MSDDEIMGPALEPFTQLWAESVAQTLGEIAGSPLICKVLPASPDNAPPGATDVWMLLAFSGALRGELAVRLLPSSAVNLAQFFMGETPAEAAELTAEHREAVLELFRQITGILSNSIRASRGEVQVRVEASAAAPTWSASSTVWLGFEDKLSSTWVELLLSAALTAALRPETASPVTRAADPAPSPVLDTKVGLELLMDVELGVTLRFGKRRMLLREILDLNPGSVLTLDRQVQEPADMLLDGRLVARGEVVVVDGNYGFRVTEVGPAS